MNKDVKNQIMTGVQLRIFAHHTCQWWNAVFVQEKRFREEFDRTQGIDPWMGENADRIFVPERMFLITAIFHAIDGLAKLDVELQRDNDYSLKCVLEKIYATVPWKDIKNLRDMNEHGVDYLVGQGKFQSHLISTYTADKYKVQLSAHWTYQDGDDNLLLFGKVPVEKLLNIMKMQQPIVWKKVEEIVNRSYVRE